MRNVYFHIVPAKIKLSHFPEKILYTPQFENTGMSWCNSPRGVLINLTNQLLLVTFNLLLLKAQEHERINTAYQLSP